MTGPSNNVLFEEARAHFNEPILLGGSLARCIGYGEDEDDCYIIATYLGGKTVWHTFVGGYTYLGCLRGQGQVKASSGEEWDDLTRLDSFLSLNSSPAQAAFRVSIEHNRAAIRKGEA